MAFARRVTAVFLTAAAWAAGQLLPLDLDDECAAPGGQCGLGLLQLRTSGPENDMLPQLNGMLASKLSMLNGVMAGKLKAKDPMQLHMAPMHKGQAEVNMKDLHGMSALSIKTLKATDFTAPAMTLDVAGSWAKDLELTGDAKGSMPRAAPFSVYLQGVSFDASAVKAILDADTGEITEFKVGGVRVHIGGSHAQVRTRSRFFARILSNAVSKKVKEKEGTIAGKMAGKITEVLTKMLNEKVKGMLNQKINEKLR